MKTTKKTLTLVIIALMTFMILPQPAQAADAICKIGEAEFVDFGTALTAADDGETITLLTNIDYNTGIKIEGITVTFDLDGHTLNVSKYGGYGLEVGIGGKLILIEDGGQFNVNSIGDYYGVYAHDGGQSTVTSATANPDANSAGAYATGAASTIWVTGNVISGGGTVGDGAYATDGGAVFVGGYAQGSRGARAGGTNSRVEVTGDATGGALFGAVAEDGGIVIVGGDASGSTGARARGGGSRVEVIGDAIGDGYGAYARDGGIVTVGGNAQGGTIGAYASGTTEAGVSSRVEVAGNAGGSVGAHAWLGGSVRVSGYAGGMTGIIAEGVDSTVWVAGDVFAALAPGSVGAAAIDGGTATIEGAIYNPGEEAGEEVEWVYIKLEDESKASDEGEMGTAPYENYLIYTDENGNTVRVKINADCMIGATIYPTLKEALDEVESDQTITLLRDINYVVEMPDRPNIVITGINITFDLNGHTLNVTSSVGHALEVGNGGVVNLIENGGEFNVTATGYGVYAHDGGQAAVSNTTATGFGGAGAYAENGGGVIVSGNAEGMIGARASGSNSRVDVNDDVTSTVGGVVAENGGFVNVHGNVSVSEAGIPEAVGVYITDPESTVLIGGDLTITGTNATGVSLMLGSSAIIQGEFTAPEEAYIELITLDGDTPVIAILTAGDGVPGTLPEELRSRLGLPDESYRVYTDGANAVYVRMSVAPTIITDSLPDGTVGIAYSQTLAATGSAPITWSMADGSDPLPGGLTLSGEGVISGTPTTAGTFNFTVKATNAAGSDTQAFSITITAASVAPSITTDNLSDGTVGIAYSQSLAATGSASITWSLDSGDLPGGLTLSSSGVISGTPTTAGTFNFNVKAANGISPDATKALSIVISAGPTYSLTITAGTGGSATGSGDYAPGAVVTITATPSSGYKFSQWTIVSGTGAFGNANNASTTFTMAEGAATIRAAFAPVDDGDDDDPDYIPRTLTDSVTGITISGSLIYRDAALTIKDMALDAAGTCDACDAIRERMADDDFNLLFGKDIALSGGFNGSLTITVPVGSAYNGQTVTILHCSNGTLETFTVTVKDGKAIFNVTSLSPFAAFVEDGLDDIPKTGDSSSPWVWWLLCGVSAMGIVALIVLSKRKKAYKR